MWLLHLTHFISSIDLWKKALDLFILAFKALHDLVSAFFLLSPTLTFSAFYYSAPQFLEATSSLGALPFTWNLPSLAPSSLPVPLVKWSLFCSFRSDLAGHLFKRGSSQATCGRIQPILHIPIHSYFLFLLLLKELINLLLLKFS